MLTFYNAVFFVSSMFYLLCLIKCAIGHLSSLVLAGGFNLKKACIADCSIIIR